MLQRASRRATRFAMMILTEVSPLRLELWRSTRVASGLTNVRVAFVVAGLEDWSVALQLLIEVMLSADGRYDCLRKTSNPKMSVGIMYCFVLATSVMLVNMLIALMAKVGHLCALPRDVSDKLRGDRMYDDPPPPARPPRVV